MNPQRRYAAPAGLCPGKKVIGLPFIPGRASHLANAGVVGLCEPTPAARDLFRVHLSRACRKR
jgi:hypothetical protein